MPTGRTIDGIAMKCFPDTILLLHIYVTGFTKTVLIGTRNEIQFIADY